MSFCFKKVTMQENLFRRMVYLIILTPE